MILAIETSSPQASIAVWDETKHQAVWSDSFVTNRRHNSIIFKYLEQALKIAGDDLEYIAIGTGPGSYSGVRVGIAAANGISIARNVPVVGVSSLEAYSESENNYLVSGDARRNTYFLAKINDGKLSGEPDLLDRDVFVKQIAEAGGLPSFTMDESVAEEFNGIEHGYPLAELVARRAHQIGNNNINQPIEPHYLRPPFITKAKKKPVPGFPAK